MLSVVECEGHGVKERRGGVRGHILYEGPLGRGGGILDNIRDMEKRRRQSIRLGQVIILIW